MHYNSTSNRKKTNQKKTQLEINYLASEGERKFGNFLKVSVNLIEKKIHYYSLNIHKRSQNK